MTLFEKRLKCDGCGRMVRRSKLQTVVAAANLPDARGVSVEAHCDECCISAPAIRAHTARAEALTIAAEQGGEGAA